MTIVITLPQMISNEVDAIVSLLDRRGIDRLHLRKPMVDDAAVANLVAAIPQRYYERITMHDHHAIAQQYGLGGLHLTGRCRTLPEGWGGLVSTSCHSLAELQQRKAEGRYDYLSLSPIYDSISKEGYRAAFSRDELEEARRRGIIDEGVLALGGVTFDRLDEVRRMGFGGAMILGDAWRAFSRA